jgi:hypothetical protein
VRGLFERERQGALRLRLGARWMGYGGSRQVALDLSSPPSGASLSQPEPVTGSKLKRADSGLCTVVNRARLSELRPKELYNGLSSACRRSCAKAVPAWGTVSGPLGSDLRFEVARQAAHGPKETMIPRSRERVLDVAQGWRYLRLRNTRTEWAQSADFRSVGGSWNKSRGDLFPSR